MGISQAVFWLICLSFSVGSRAVGSKRIRSGIRQFLNDEPGKTPSTTAPSHDGGEPDPEIPCAHRNQCGRHAGLPFHARNCFCDSSCRAYGDCCRDYDPKEAQGTGPDMGPVIPHSVRGIVSCRRVEEIDTSYEMYIVDSCPKGYKDRFVVEKCQNELTPGLFYRLPVTGRTSGVLYRNVYCAACAGDEDVAFWEMAYKCSEADWLSSGTLRKIETAEEFRRLTHHLRCPVEMIPPAGRRPRKCKSNIDRCPRRWRDDRVSSKCKGYTAYVYHGLQVFKNKHCAICNNVDEAVVQCDDTRTPWPDFESRLNEGGGASSEATPSPVYVIFDTNAGSGVIRRTFEPTTGREKPVEDGGPVVVELGRCTEGSIYDVFADTCRFMGCRDGKCHPAAANLTTTVSPAVSKTAETKTVPVNTAETSATETVGKATSTVAVTSTKATTVIPKSTSTIRRTYPELNRDFKTSPTATNKARTPYYEITRAYKSITVTETTHRDKLRKSKSKTTLGSTTRRKTASTKITTITTTSTASITSTTPVATTTTSTSPPTTVTSSPTIASSSASTSKSTTTATSTKPTTTTTIPTTSTAHTTTSTAAPPSTSTAREAFVLIIPMSTVGDNRAAQPGVTLKSDDDLVKVTRPARGRHMEINPKDVKLVAPSNPSPTPGADTAGATAATALPEGHNGYLEGEMELSGREAADGEDDSNKSRNCSDILVMFQFDRLQSLASFIGTLTSLISLLVSFVTILVLPSMRQTVRGKVLLSLILSLFVAQVLYLAALPSNQTFASRVVCYWTGTVLHYCVLAVFFWVSVLAIDTALSIMGNQRELETCESWGRVFGYSLYAWLTPAVIVAACLTAEALEADHLLIRPCYGQGVCWVTGRFSLLLAVALPAGVLTLVSLFLFFLSASHMCVNVTYKDLKTKRHRIPDGRRLALCVCLCLIVALTWVSGFVATFARQDPVWWVFIGFSSSQGIFICVAFVCTRKIFQRLKDIGGQSGKGSSSATNWSYQKDRGPATAERTSTAGRTPTNRRFPGVENEIVLHETSM